MKVSQFAFLADQNIHPEVVTFLAGCGLDVVTAESLGLAAVSDASMLHAAHRANRVVITHDSDFGALAVARGEPIVGIVYLRPGHITAGYTVASLTVLLDADLEVRPPFLLVADRRQSKVRLRLRML